MTMQPSRCCLPSTVSLREGARHEEATRSTIGMWGALRHRDRDALAAEEDSFW